MHGINVIVTLLYDKENPHVVMEECERQGIMNIRIPLKGATEHTLKDPVTVEIVTIRMKELYELLNLEEKHVLIHCSAGIHRTGTMAYTLLRMHGLG
jgi:protein tyrosine/serine phosphatase